MTIGNFSLFEYLLILFLFCQFNQILWWYLYGPAPGFEVLLSRLDAKLHVADVRAELPGLVAVKCSVLKYLLKCRCVRIWEKEDENFIE